MDIKEFFDKNRRVAVAFSGGVDSSVLLMLAKKYAENFKAYYVKSAFQPQFEFDDAAKVARLLGVELEVITLDVLADKDVAANPKNRCYYCKKRIFAAICNAALRDGFTCVCDGTNASDDIADRPGFKALQEMSVKSPLRECGYTKSNIRALGRENNLPVADKSSYACLATRIPAGTAITAELLQKTERAEDKMRALGFDGFRVRYLGGAAKIELTGRDFELFYNNKDEVYGSLSADYSGVYLDLKERNDE